jgi:transcriptional regulator GlxA family with amidase domain
LLSKLTELLLVDRSPWSRPRSQKQIVARAMAYIQTHYAGIHAIADVANACGVSIRTLESAFQSEVDQTPSEALRNCRLEEARRKIMHDRDRGITEIALACGFNHLGRFSGAYRSRFGILPSAEQAGAAEAAGGSSSSDIG